MNAGSYIRNTRIHLGLTQARLGKMAGCSQSDISKYERGTRPSRLEVISRLASALQITREEVIFGPLPQQRGGSVDVP